MFMLSSSTQKYPMYYSSGTMFNAARGENQSNIDATNSLTPLSPEVSFTAPEGTYEARDCLTLHIPIPHPADPPPAIMNPLAPTFYLPQAYSSGVKLSVISFKFNPPQGTLETDLQSQTLYNNQHNSLSQSYPASSNGASTQHASNTAKGHHQQNSASTQLPPTTGSRWKPSFFGSSSSNSRRNSTVSVPIQHVSEEKQQFDEKSHSFSSIANDRLNGQIQVKSISESPSTYSLGNMQGTFDLPNRLPNSLLQQNSNTSSSSNGKKKGMVSPLALESLSISETINGAPSPCEQVFNPSVFVCHQPTGVCGTSLIPPNAIGSNPALSNLQVFIPLDAPAVGKKRKSKHSHLVKNSSSLLSKTIVHDSLSRRLGDRSLDDEFVVWVNMGRSLQWLDFSTSPASSTAAQISREDTLSTIFFIRSHPLCHDVNPYTRSPNGLDVVVGMSTGDILWLDSANNRYARLNKNRDITRSPVTAIKWVPGSENLFVTLHANGALIMFDKDREDGFFAKSGGLSHVDSRSTSGLRIIKSLYDNTDYTNVGQANGANSNSNSDNQGGGPKNNPLAIYKLSRKALTSIEFSLDRQTVVVTSADGYLRFLNLATEVLTDIFPSYFGGFLCCAFSPDGKYLATGGEDDLVSIWSIKRRTLIARGHGHRSWVRQVAFDPWNCDTKFSSYRLGSVGDDGDLLLWDFSSKTLSRPKAQQRTKDNVRKTKEKRQTSMSSSRNPFLESVSSNTGVSGGNAEDSNSHMLKPIESSGAISIQTGNTYSLGGPTTTAVHHGGSIFNTVPQSTVVHPFVSKYDVSQLTPIVTLNVKFDFSKFTTTGTTEANGSTDKNSNGSEGAHRHNSSESHHPEPHAEALSDIVFLEKVVMVASKDGRIWTWNRPKGNSN